MYMYHKYTFLNQSRGKASVLNNTNIDCAKFMNTKQLGKKATNLC